MNDNTKLTAHERKLLNELKRRCGQLIYDFNSFNGKNYLLFTDTEYASRKNITGQTAHALLNCGELVMTRDEYRERDQSGWRAWKHRDCVTEPVLSMGGGAFITESLASEWEDASH